MNEKLQRWINWIQYDELIAGKNNNPKKLLGLHDYYKGQVVTAYKPHAVCVKVMSSTGKNVMEMEPVGEDGFFGLYLPKKVYKNYVFETTYEDGSTVTLADPYAFEPQISDMDIYLFAEFLTILSRVQLLQTSAHRTADGQAILTQCCPLII